MEICGNVGHPMGSIIELKQKAMSCKDLGRSDVKHDAPNK